MISKFYLASVLVFPGQFNRIHCCPWVSVVHAPSLPSPSISSFGNYHSVKRYFSSGKKAHTWAARIVKKFSVGPKHNPLLSALMFHGGQLSLF